MRIAKQSLTRENAEALALTALSFLASDEPRLVRFLQLTGIEPGALRARAGDAETLIAVLDHLLGDQSLLLVFTSDADIKPEEVETARVVLSGNNNPGVWL